MQYNLKSTDVLLSSEIRQYLDKKLAHIEKILSAHTPTYMLDVDLAHTASALEKAYKASFRLHGNGKDMYAQATGTTLHEAIDMAVAELGRELVRTKEKDRRSMRTQAARVKDFFRGLRKRI